MCFRLHPEGDFTSVERYGTHEKQKYADPSKKKPGGGMYLMHTLAKRDGAFRQKASYESVAEKHETGIEGKTEDIGSNGRFKRRMER